MMFPTWWQSLQAVRLVVRVVSFAPTGQVTGSPIILKQTKHTHLGCNIYSDVKIVTLLKHYTGTQSAFSFFF